MGYAETRKSIAEATYICYLEQADLRQGIGVDTYTLYQVWEDYQTNRNYLNGTI